MPLYEYKCKTCKTKPREFVLEFDHEPPVCPKCGEAMVKHFGKMNFKLVGDDWPSRDIKRAGMSKVKGNFDPQAHREKRYKRGETYRA